MYLKCGLMETETESEMQNPHFQLSYCRVGIHHLMLVIVYVNMSKMVCGLYQISF